MAGALGGMRLPTFPSNFRDQFLHKGDWPNYVENPPQNTGGGAPRNPVEGGGGIFNTGRTPQGGLGFGQQQMEFGIPVGYTPLFGGGGINEALMNAFNDTTNEFNSAIGGNLAPNDPRFGAFGAALQNLVTNPQGFGGERMKQIMTRLAERESGLREGQRRTVENAGGRNFSSFADVLANQQGQSAQRLNEAELNAFLQDALLQSQNRGQGIQGGTALAGILASLNSQAAQFAANRHRPLTDPGAGGTGPGNQFDLLNENGEMINFNPDGTPLSAFDRERQRQQRIAWMTQGG